MRNGLARSIGALLVIGAVAGGVIGANAVSELPPVYHCPMRLGPNYRACIILARISNDWSIHEAAVSNKDYSKAYGVSLVCFDGKYRLYVQAGDIRTNHSRRVMKLQRCRF